MELQRRWFCIAVVLVCCLAVGLLSASFATQHWVKCTLTSYNESDHGEMYINMGLFKGVKKNTVIVEDVVITVKDEFCHPSDTAEECTKKFDGFGLWVATIMFIILSLVFGGITAVFATINSILTPIETITGLTGLYLWNGIAGLVGLLAVIVWIIEFFNNLKNNMAMHFYPHNVKEVTKLDYSFWLAVAGMLTYCINFILVYAAGYKWKAETQKIRDENADGVIMLY